MYRAKSAGGGCDVFTSAMQTDLNERADAESFLRGALDSNALLAYFQPTYSLRACRVTAMESLLRWPTERGVRLPSSFIALAEQTGMMLPLGEWILRTACEKCQTWRSAGFESMRVSVNISPMQLLPQNALSVIKNIVDETGLESTALEIEINARALTVNDDQVSRALRGLHDLGITLAIDDFGAVHSSLGFMRHAPIDIIKIDPSFTHNVATDSNDRQIFKAIVGMAKSLHVEVVGKGVETARQLDVLQQEGCDYLQGYYFSRPMPEQDVCGWLHSRSGMNSAFSLDST